MTTRRVLLALMFFSVGMAAALGSAAGYSDPYRHIPPTVGPYIFWAFVGALYCIAVRAGDLECPPPVGETILAVIHGVLMSFLLYSFYFHMC